MKVEEIIKLLDAGYSKDEIMEMNKEPEQQEESQEPEQEVQPEPEQQPEQEDMTAAVKEFKSAIEDLKKEFIAANIMASNQAGEKEVTAETAVANIINPFTEREGK